MTGFKNVFAIFLTEHRRIYVLYVNSHILCVRERVSETNKQVD